MFTDTSKSLRSDSWVLASEKERVRRGITSAVWNKILVRECIDAVRALIEAQETRIVVDDPSFL
jgi:hypothetical protein